jgi:hypothetical protein
MKMWATRHRLLRGHKLGWELVFLVRGGSLTPGIHGKRGRWDFSSSDFLWKGVCERVALPRHIQSMCKQNDLSCKELYFCLRNENTYHYQSVSMNNFLNFYISLLAAIFPSSGASSFLCGHALAREGWPRLLTATTTHGWMKRGSMSGDSVVEASTRRAGSFGPVDVGKWPAPLRGHPGNLKDFSLAIKQPSSSEGTARDPRTAELYEDPPLYWVPYVMCRLISARRHG